MVNIPRHLLTGVLAGVLISLNAFSLEYIVRISESVVQVTTLGLLVSALFYWLGYLLISFDLNGKK